MKQFLIFFILAFMCLNTYGQDAYVGKLIGMSSLIIDPDYPPVPCLMTGLETTSCKYILSINSHWICGKLIVEDVEYLIGDEVEIIGTIIANQDINSNAYIELEIETIKKLTSNIELVPFSSNNVYYDATNQVIVIDETLQNQSFTLELIDTRGKIIWRETGLSNKSAISVANLSNGIYLYRLTRDGIVICTDKILKKN